MTIGLEAVALAWAGASDEHKAAALAALQGAPNPDGPGRLLTLTEAARRLGMARCSVHRLVRRGALRTLTAYPGANPRISESELARFASGAAA